MEGKHAIPNRILEKIMVVHNEIHNPLIGCVVFGKVSLPIKTLKDNSRYVQLENKKYTVMQQSESKMTSFAARARTGERHSWLAFADRYKPWLLIDDNGIHGGGRGCSFYKISSLSKEEEWNKAE